MVQSIAGFLRRYALMLSALSFVVLMGCSSQQGTRADLIPAAANLDTVRAGQFDTGKMWTFDFPPVQYFAQAYNFSPTKEWFDKARLSSLRLPGCSASFVSEDGLVMSNHHCARGTLQRVQKEGEKLVEVGFYAATLEEERKAPVWVDQLVLMEDVTREVQEAFDRGGNDSAKTANRTAKISEIQRSYAQKFKEAAATAKDSMVFNVYTFYNGGRYSLYGFKRYTDVRLVFAPEEKSAFFGGDPDNFTYPRYDFDCSFFRVYENGQPLKTANYFRFSKNGPSEGEPVFLIGNPGTTNRLMTLAQLETLRDIQYPTSIDASSSRLRVLNDFVAHHPDRRLEFLNQIFGIANGRKATSGYLHGLRDSYLMAKKKDFEKRFKEAVLGNASLKSKYGDPWSEISALEEQRRPLLKELSALNVLTSRSQYLSIAGRLVDRARGVRPTAGPSARGPLFPATFEPEIEVQLLADQLKFMKQQLGDRTPAFNKLLARGATAEILAKNTMLGSKSSVDSLANGKPEDVLSSTDPIIAFVVESRARATELQTALNDIRDKEAVPTQRLGRALYEVYGTSIPPDASFSLRIADGVVKGYEYNGTLAPPMTTFYGLYDRYYSFGKQDPWLPGNKWIPPPADLTMNTPLNFSSTNDAIGGNSGSPVVNKDLEIVGLLFDGNIESLPGNIIYDETNNRSVSVHSSGIIEGAEKVYKATRLAQELKTGKIAK